MFLKIHYLAKKNSKNGDNVFVRPVLVGAMTFSWEPFRHRLLERWIDTHIYINLSENWPNIFASCTRPKKTKGIQKTHSSMHEKTQNTKTK